MKANGFFPTGIAVVLLWTLTGPAIGQSSPEFNSNEFNEAQRNRLRLTAQLFAQREAEQQAALDAFAQLVHLAPSDGQPAFALHRVENGTPRFVQALSNLDAAFTIAATDVWPSAGTGFSLTGLGQVLGLWDSGSVRSTHQEFLNNSPSRVVQQDASSTTNGHATMVAGGMIGAGTVSAASGIAPEATLWTHDWFNDLSEMTRAAADFLQASNHSYGDINGWGSQLNINGVTLPAWYGDIRFSDSEDYHFGFYGPRAHDWDHVAYLAPYYLIVKAAGNDRQHQVAPGTNHWFYDYHNSRWASSTDARERDGGSDGFDSIIGDGAVAKNVLTVGAAETLPDGYQHPDDVRPYTGSSFGPVDDGRIKPDLVSAGEAGYSAYHTSDTSYGSYSGTSMATSLTTGAVGLVHHQRALLDLPSLRAASVKALLIHTAREAGPAPGPDYRHGWGLLNVFDAVKLVREDALTDPGLHLREAHLPDGSTLVFDVESDGTAPLKVTLAWSDPPGLPPEPALNPTDRMLVHDLDLRLQHHGPQGPGPAFLPWVLDPSLPDHPATPGDNIRDNVEQVYIATPAPGTYSVIITHKGSLTAPDQAVSVLVSGNRNAALFHDHEGDGLYAVHEDVNGNGSIFDDDTDQNGVPNYLDLDDDGDGILTAIELAGYIVDGEPVNPPDSNNNGIPDHLDPDVALPVEWSGFEAVVTGTDAVQLRWMTASERNNAGFFVMQKSDFGLRNDVAQKRQLPSVNLPSVGFAIRNPEWESVGWVDGHGTTTEAQVYHYRVTGLTAGRHRFRLKQIDFEGTVGYSPEMAVEVALPGPYVLGPAYPNPFNPRTRLSLMVAQSQAVRVEVFDLMGRRVARLHDGVLEAREPHSFTFSAEALPSGLYVIRATGEHFVDQQTVTLMK